MEEHESRVIYLRNLADSMYTLDKFQNQYFMSWQHFRRRCTLTLAISLGNFFPQRDGLKYSPSVMLMSNSPDLKNI